MVSAKQRANWARFARMAKARARKAKGRSKPRRVKAPMARRKKRYGRKRKGGVGKKAMPLGVAIGVGASGMEMLTEKMPDGTISVAEAVFYPYGSIGKKVSAVGSKLKVKSTQLDNYKWALGGILVSAAPRIPVLRVLARPVDSAVRRLGKGKVSL